MYNYIYIYPIGISQYNIDYLILYNYDLETVSDKYLLGNT